MADVDSEWRSDHTIGTERRHDPGEHERPAAHRSGTEFVVHVDHLSGCGVPKGDEEVVGIAGDLPQTAIAECPQLDRVAFVVGQERPPLGDEVMDSGVECSDVEDEGVIGEPSNVPFVAALIHLGGDTS